jgi:glycosyltransferase involved in cell wall biosynthesis
MGMDRVVLDLERLKFPYSGLGQFCLHFGNSLLSEARSHAIEPVVLTRRSSSNLLQGASQHLWANWWRKEAVSKYLRWLPWPETPPPALWHATHHQSKFWPSDPKIPVLLTIHDLKFLQLSQGADVEHKLACLQKTVDRVSAIATISHAVKNDITTNLNLRGKPVRVIYNGVYPTGSIAPQRPARVKSQPFLFSIGVFERKKNFHTLIEMMEHLPELNLVLAGNYQTSYGRFVRSCAELKNYRDRIIFLGTISDAERQWLYENCTAFVFASLAEGFGLPVLEAMGAGRPVVLAHCTSLPEVGGSLASYWHQFDSVSMAQTVREGLYKYAIDASLPARLIEHSNQFSWTKAAAQYVRWYREIIDATASRNVRLAAA